MNHNLIRYKDFKSSQSGESDSDNNDEESIDDW